jgi:aminoglycoside phosphotransferase (APT) family kinase protein
MHEDEVPTDVALVRRLVAEQFPGWAGMNVAPVPSSGTVNALYRLGDDLVVRLPRIAWALAGAEREREWLPRLAPLLPVEVPTLVAVGEPGAGYPWSWTVYRWLDGVNPAVGNSTNADLLAEDLAELVLAFRRIELAGPPTRRGAALATRDDETRAALAALVGTIETGPAEEAWDAALRLPDWQGSSVWIHGDLLPGNILVSDGRLSGFLDFEAAGVGDPACDLIPAWAVLPRRSRRRFRDAADVDDATWGRGRGWALSIALIALPYYVETNPPFAALARHMIREVLEDD